MTRAVVRRGKADAIVAKMPVSVAEGPVPWARATILRVSAGAQLNTSKWSLWSDESFLSIASKGSVLSIGSVGSACSVGSICSFGSAFCVGSALSVASMLSFRARWRVMKNNQ
jgi:hypothetical protein